ncbi:MULTISPECIES: hypothetical protein [Bacillales]|uniref:hypothetical protein n=1 Tax=Bacillales TaxID=1385 RepID=UPI0006A7741C|nr:MULTISPECIES: hypothetical protein [Bacillales]OBZ07794.1 hypothetical protein A7975_29180 [Bacillus sp. FJAT-26390]
MRIHKKKLFVIAGLITLSIALAGCGGPANENIGIGNSEEAAKSEVAETAAAKETNTDTENVNIQFS